MLRKIIIFSFITAIANLIYAQDTINLDLEESLQMAEKNNRLIRIFQYKIENAEGRLSEMKSNFYPRVIAEGTFGYNSDPNIHVKKGEFSHIYEDLIDVGWIDEILEEYFPLPPKDMVLVHGDNYFYKTNISFYQPVSQLTSVNTGRKILTTDLRISEIKKEDVVSEIKLGVTELFYGILLETKNEEAAVYELEYKKAEYEDAVNAYEAGAILDLDVKALQAEVHEREQELLKIQNKKKSYLLSFKQLLGMDYDSYPRLVCDSLLLSPPAPLQNYMTSASKNNYSLGELDLTLQKAKFGIIEAKKEFIPELTYFLQYNYNRGIPLTPDAYLLTGLNLKWDIFTSGERMALIRQRNALFNEALEDLKYEKQSIRNEVEKVYLDLVYAEKLIRTAELAYEARKEELRLARNAVEEEEALPLRLIKAKSDFAYAEADLLGAKLNFLIIKARLERLSGEL